MNHFGTARSRSGLLLDQRLLGVMINSPEPLGADLGYFI